MPHGLAYSPRFLCVRKWNNPDRVGMAGLSGGSVDPTYINIDKVGGVPHAINYPWEGTYTTTVPEWATRAKVRLWAGGGAGGGTTTDSASRGGGGAGGQYVEKTFDVVAGQEYTIVVPSGGTGGTSNGNTGGDATISLLGSNIAVAKGGVGGYGHQNGGAGGLGSTVGGVGDVVYAGGNGCNGGTGSTGGAGGGGAGFAPKNDLMSNDFLSDIMTNILLYD